MDSTELKVNDVSDEQLVHYRFLSRNRGKLTGRLYINDVEVNTFTPDQNQILCYDIQNWLMPGDNHIVIAITDAPELESDTDDALYECSLHGLAEPGFAEDGNRMWEIRLDKLPRPAPLSMHFTFCLTSLQVPTSQLWREAEVVNVLPEEEQSQILSLQNELITAFREGNADKIMQIYRFVLNDEASMRNDDVETSLQQVEEEFGFLSQMAKEGHIRFEEPSDVYFNHLVGNRVVQLCGDSGTPALIMRDEDGESIDIQIYASKINGEWNLVRR